MSMYGKNHYNIVISLQLNKFFKKLKIQKTKIMASSPIPSWQIEEEKVETVTGFIFLDFKISADADFSHEIKMLAPWKKSYEKPR